MRSRQRYTQRFSGVTLVARGAVLLALLAFSVQTLGASVCLAMTHPQPATVQAMPDCHADAGELMAAKTAKVEVDDCCDNCDQQTCHASSAVISKSSFSVQFGKAAQQSSTIFTLQLAPSQSLFRPPILA